MSNFNKAAGGLDLCAFLFMLKGEIVPKLFQLDIVPKIITLDSLSITGGRDTGINTPPSFCLF